MAVKIRPSELLVDDRCCAKPADTKIGNDKVMKSNLENFFASSVMRCRRS